MTPAKEDSEIIENFQSNELCKQIKIMKALEDDAGMKYSLIDGQTCYMRPTYSLIFSFYSCDISY